MSAEGNLGSEYGRVVELVDSLDSGSSVHCGRAGSSPASPTMKKARFGVLFSTKSTFSVGEIPLRGVKYACGGEWILFHILRQQNISPKA